jgi:uncharacterized membrane protein YeaQ/YmgE (transglycosylase-associated protein family)
VKHSLQIQPPEPLSGIIAVVGCDGSGKSTLTSDLLAHFQNEGPCERVYLGQSSGNIATWIKGLPVIGAPVARYLARKAERTHTRKTAAPDLPTALVIYLLSQWRAHKFRRMLQLARSGVTVITDRYPQAEVPGFHFDGPGLVGAHAGGWLVRRLGAREQNLYQWMAHHVPALVIRLNIDADTAHSRKPDHKLSTLQSKAAMIPTLNFHGALVLDLDGRDPYPDVLNAAMEASRAALTSAR